MQNNTFYTVVAATLLGLFPTGAHADVVESSPAGFVVRHEVTVNAPPDKAYAALVDVASWWNGSHSYSGNVANLSIDARPGGCFCEKLPGGGGVEHMRVVMVMPNQSLRMSGALGPLQANGLAGSLTWGFFAAPGGTRVLLTYSVGGFMAGGAEKMAMPVNGMLADQIGRYKLLVDTGKPDTGVPPK